VPRALAHAERGALAGDDEPAWAAHDRADVLGVVGKVMVGLGARAGGKLPSRESDL